MANLKTPQPNTLNLGAHWLQYEVMLSQRKTVQLVLKNAQHLIIKAPKNFNKRAILEIIAKREDWLIKHIEGFISDPPAEKPKFEDGAEHFYLGQAYTLSLKDANAKRFSHFNGRFLITAPNANPNMAEKLLYRFYTTQAKTLFYARLRALHPQFPELIPMPELSVRRMKSRFGSMSANAKMALNTELVKVDTKYLDYVILHELCHLKFMDHKSGFYALLDRACPAWKPLKKELARLLPLH